MQAARFRAQLLSGPPAADPVEVAGRLLAVQGQDGRGFRLAVRARTSGLTGADVDRALAIDRSLVVTWLNRGTLHLIRTEDYWPLHRLVVRPQFEQQCRRMLAGCGVDEAGLERGVAVVDRALAADGPLTREQLRARIAEAGLPAQGNASLHILAIASTRGLAVRGPMAGQSHAYAYVRDWIGPPPPDPEPEVALGWLARRYLAGHGPANDRDLAKWAGLPLGHARRGLTEIAAELRDRPDGLAELAGTPVGADRPELPGLRLLGPYDPVLLGWADRQPVLGEHQEIVTVNGLFRPFVLFEGRAAGIWSLAGGDLAVDLFGPLSSAAQSALAAEEADVRRFLAAGPVPDEDGG